jgi:hypothetical protein
VFLCETLKFKIRNEELSYIYLGFRTKVFNLHLKNFHMAGLIQKIQKDTIIRVFSQFLAFPTILSLKWLCNLAYHSLIFIIFKI